MKKYARIAVCFLAVAFAIPVRAVENSSSQSATSTAKPLPSIVFQTLDIGGQSGCVRPAKMLIASDAEWQRVWKLHSQVQVLKTSAPPIDFSRQSVIALLGGQSMGGASLEIVQIVPGKNTTIYYAQTRGWKDAKAASQPFHFAVVPKIDNTLRFADANEECAVCVVH